MSTVRKSFFFLLWGGGEDRRHKDIWKAREWKKSFLSFSSVFSLVSIFVVYFCIDLCTYFLKLKISHWGNYISYICTYIYIYIERERERQWEREREREQTISKDLPHVLSLYQSLPLNIYIYQSISPPISIYVTISINLSLHRTLA